MSFDSMIQELAPSSFEKRERHLSDYEYIQTNERICEIALLAVGFLAPFGPLHLRQARTGL